MLTRSILNSIQIIGQAPPQQVAEFLLGLATGIAFLLVSFPVFKK